MNLEELRDLWFPIAAAVDTPLRHVHQTQLLGREYAVWRADDGYVNVWENRCLHRGVRLSIGINEGSELRCQYHGWRYANRSAGCTYIPAHPADAPARTICNRTFPAQERYGLIWSGEEPVGDPPRIEALERAGSFGLRSLPIHATPALVLEHLSAFRLPGDAPPTVDDQLAPWIVTHESAAGSLVYLLQPVDSGRTFLRCVMAGTPPDGERFVRRHAAALGRLVDRIEADAATRVQPTPIEPKLERLPVELSVVPEAPAGRHAPLRVQVVRKWETATGVTGFELEPTTGVLPTFQPGAHIDVHLPNGMIRQYSLTNGPGDTERYRIGVKREPTSRGGSATLTDSVREGDVLAISAPRNNFPLRRDALRTVFIAGGIGVTPLLAMAQSLAAMALPFEFHQFAQSAAHRPFAEVIDELGDAVVAHLGRSPAQTEADIAALLGEPSSAAHLYVCGPAPMLEATRRIAADLGWPDDAVHFEYFANTAEIDDSTSFEIALARSALTLEVDAGKTVLEVLRANGIAIESSCEQGACGTCVVPVIEGDPDHHDVYLNETERAANDRMMSCVSRSAGPRLVLDL